MAIRTRKPRWLAVPLPGSPRYHALKRRTRELSLSTVCEEASCPNIGECWGCGTATFMVMGEVCTRACRFCGVGTSRRPPPLDPDEPLHLAEAVVEMGLDYAVITSVDRDDLPDGGAGHFRRCIEAVRRAKPDTAIEVLIPDFSGEVGHLAQVVEACPEVIGHNVETVERLSPTVRDPRASYRQSLQVLSQVKDLDRSRWTKSSLMVGLGETGAEVEQTLRDLREVGVELVTIGQYLQPSRRHLEVVEFLPPERFEAWRELGLDLGFTAVASGPLVRSSYRAGELWELQRGAPR